MNETTKTDGPDGLVLRADDDGKRLKAVYMPVEGRVPAGLAEVKAAIEAAGYADWHLLDDALAEFVAAAREATAPVSKEIAEARDAEVQVSVSKDEMQATLNLVPAEGGTPATVADVYRLLEEKRVTYGLLREEISAAVAAGRAEGRVIARGEPPENGRDARFVMLLRSQQGRQPKIDDRGMADYRDLGSFLTVEPGESLMRRIPATPGRPGRNIHGQVISPKGGRDTPFTGGLKGARASGDDPNVLVSEIGGLPTVLPDGVRVDPVITVETIDLSTGNLDFDGVVNVKGDVATGLRIKASGDVFIAGTVEGAEIETPGSVEVKGGIVGQANSRASVKAGGNVKARFIINAVIEAGDSVAIGNEITNSEVTAKRQVVVGGSSAKAQIVGGVTRATYLIQAPVLGSSAGVHTRLFVGQDPDGARALAALQAIVREKSEQRDELLKALQTLIRKGEHQSERTEKVRATVQHLMTELRELEAQERELQEKLATAAEARIVAGRQVHANLELNLAGTALALHEDAGPRTFALRDGKIVCV